MQNLTPQQRRRLEKLLKVEQEGVTGILEYLFEIEEKIDTEIPSIKDIISKVKGEKGDTYVLEDDDRDDIAQRVRNLISDDELSNKVLSKMTIDYNVIAKKASDYIVVPKSEKVDYSKVKDIVLKDIVIKDGENGKDADEEMIREKIENNLIKELPQYADKFRDGLELLLDNERLDIKAIKGLEDYKEVSKLAKDSVFLNRGGNGKGLLSQMNDVSITNPTNNQIIKYNSTTDKWENGAGGTSTFISLTDVPTSYTGAGDRYVKVKATEDGLEFVAGSGASVAFGDITGSPSDNTSLQTVLDGKVDENSTITGATKTKITYDSKGLVTAGADATTADIADSTNKRYVTDAQLTVVGNTSGTNTGDVSVTDTDDIDLSLSGQNISSSLKSTAISSKTLKSTLSGTEEVIINDAGTLKKTTTQDIADLGGGGGGGAPTGAEYVTLSTSGSLTHERVLTAGTGVSITDNGAGSTVVVASTITQYTDEMAQDTVGGILTTSAEISFTYNDTTPSITANIVAGSIDEAKLDETVNTSLDLADSSLQPSDVGVSVQSYNSVLDSTTASFTTEQETKLSNITVTQAVDLDTIESDTVTNNAKVSNATHTGDVTGSTTLTLDKTAITGKTAVTPATGDYIIISDTSDSGNLKKALISDLPSGGGYTLTVASANVATLTDAGTLYFGGNVGFAPSATADIYRIYIPKTGTITKAYIFGNFNVAGTAESWTLYIRHNNTTDYTIEAITVSDTKRLWDNNALSISVTEGDYIEIKSINPTWATNPTNGRWNGVIYIE